MQPSSPINKYINEEVAPPVQVSKKKVGVYSWIVLGLLFLMRISMNWQRKSLSYIYGFKGDIGQNTNFYEILQVYPEMNQYYGALQGFAYTLPFSFAGVLLGLLPNNYNRKTLLSAVVALGGLT